MTTVEWRDSRSWPGYQVSSAGQLRLTIKRRSRSPRILHGNLMSNGYVMVQTTFNGKKVAATIHRLVCEAFHGPVPSRAHQVRHLNGIRNDNRAINLAWGTGKENAADRRRHGRDRIAAAHPCAKLDEWDVVAIFVLARRGYTGEEIGRLFDLNRNSINKIIARKSWASVAIPDDLIAGGRVRNAANLPHFLRSTPRELRLFGERAA